MHRPVGCTPELTLTATVERSDPLGTSKPISTKICSTGLLGSTEVIPAKWKGGLRPFETSRNNSQQCSTQEVAKAGQYGLATAVQLLPQGALPCKHR